MTMQPSKKKSVISVKDKLEGNEIDLSLLELTEVPVKELSQVTRGTVLDLSNNKLVTLSVGFPSLVHLVKLDLSKNQLKELPVNFGDLKNLRHLDLYSNQLQRLPVSFHQLKELRWLDLKNNQLVPTLAEAAGDCLDQKGCQEAARKVVKLMTVVHSELEKKRLKEQEASKAQLAQKNAEERAREQQSKMDKKAEKDKRRAEAAKQQANSNVNNKMEVNSKARSGVKNDKKVQQHSHNQTKVVQGHSFCVEFFMLALRLLFVAGLLSAAVFALNWEGPLTLANAGIVAHRSVEQVVRHSQEIYDWALPHLKPVQEQWKHLSRFVADNGRDLIFIVWEKTQHYARVVQQQALIIWPLVQQRATEVSSLAVQYWRIVCQEAPVYYQALVDKITQLYYGAQTHSTGKQA